MSSCAGSRSSFAALRAGRRSRPTASRSACGETRSAAGRTRRTSGARDEAVALLAGDLDDEAIEQILDDFGLAVDPPAHGLSYGRWLALVADVLTAALREGGGG